MIELFLLAIALAMDAFAVSISLGAKLAGKPTRQIRQKTVSLAIWCGLYFGVAQGLMPLIGYLFGAVLIGWLAAAAPWIACSILVGLGSKMLFEAFKSEASEDLRSEGSKRSIGVRSEPLDSVISPHHINHKVMMSLAIATSIDAMAAGFTLNLLAVNAWLACVIIALVTAGFAGLGIYLGKQSGTWLEDKAEMLGGLVLIAIGIKMVI